MNKTELQQHLESTYAKVGTPVLVDDSNDVNTYDVSVFEVTDSSAVRKTVSFYVKDEGKETEEAYLRHAEDHTFTTALNTKIATLEGKNNILKIVVDSTNEDKGFAEVTAYVDNAGTVSKVTKFVVKNGEDFDIYNLE